MHCSDAIGFRTAAALEAYEEELGMLCGDLADPRASGGIQLALRRVCSDCLPLPELSGAAVALMLAHHRFLADLSRSGGDLAEAEAARSLHALELCVGLLKRRCRELFLAPHLH